jgi:hypothetical protein
MQFKDLISDSNKTKYFFSRGERRYPYDPYTYISDVYVAPLDKDDPIIKLYKERRRMELDYANVDSWRSKFNSNAVVGEPEKLRLMGERFKEVENKVRFWWRDLDEVGRRDWVNSFWGVKNNRNKGVELLLETKLFESVKKVYYPLLAKTIDELSAPYRVDVVGGEVVRGRGRRKRVDGKVDVVLEDGDVLGKFMEDLGKEDDRNMGD